MGGRGGRREGEPVRRLSVEGVGRRWIFGECLLFVQGAGGQWIGGRGGKGEGWLSSWRDEAKTRNKAGKKRIKRDTFG